MDQYEVGSQNAPNGLWDWDLKSNRFHYSSGWISMLGWGGAEFGNSSEEWFGRIHPEDAEAVQREISAQLAHGASQFEIPHRMLHQDGCYRWMVCRGMISRDNSGQATRIRGFHLDKTNEKVIDPVTGLPNRLLLLDRLSRSIEKSKKRDDFLFAVLVVDLDLFESGINHLDTINTDPLVTAAARRLETSLGSRDVAIRQGRAHLISRSGGEEFIVLLEGLQGVGEAKKTADKLLNEILAPFEFNGKDVFLSPSIGIALSATKYRTAEEALRDADTALYRAKCLGKCRCEVFDTAAMETVQSRSRLEQEIQRALAKKEFVVYFQPIVNLSTSQVAGFEALVRWNHPARGLVSPMEFIPVAEKSGLIIALDRQIMQQACRQLKRWKDDPRVSSDVYVSVNMSSSHFRQPALVKEIRGVLSDTGLDADNLMIELTEGTVMEDPETARELLMQLRVMGVRIAVDDFGTGYSSLAYLRRFPLDYLKIDHAFIRSIESNADNLEIVRAITLLAQQLGLRVIAEGIESSRQLDLIRSLNCAFGQGFLFSKAVQAEEAEKILIEGFEHKSSPESGPPSHPAKKASEIPRGKMLVLPKRKLLVWGLALALPLIAAPFMKRSPEQPSTSIQPAAPPVLQQIQTPAPSTWQPEKSVPANFRAEAPVLKPAKPLQNRPIAAPIPTVIPTNIHSLEVIHDHAFGSCKGTLRIERGAIAFVSEKGKDSFSSSLSECSCTADRDWLIIKAANRTYRFKSASAASKEENRSQISQIQTLFSRQK